MLLLLAAVALETVPARRYVLGKVTEILRGQGIDFHAASLQYDLFSLSAQVREVVVRSGQAPSLPPIASVQQISLQASWRALLGGTIAINRVDIQKPTIDVVVTSGGASNIPHLPGSPTRGGTLRIIVSEVAIQNGSMSWRDQSRNLAISVPDWHAQVRRAPAGGFYDLSLTATHTANLQFQNREMPIEHAGFNGRLTGTSLTVNRFQVASPLTILSVTGSIANLTAPTVNLVSDVQIDIGRWAQMLGLRQPLRGRIEAHLMARGPWSGLRVEGPIRSAGLVAGAAGPVTLRSTMLLDSATKHLQFNPVDARMLSGTVQGKLSIPVAPMAGGGEIALRYTGLDLLRLTRSLHLSVHLASNASGGLSARWPGLSFQRAAWKLQTMLTEQRSFGKGTLPVSGVMSAASRGSGISIELHGVESLGIQADGHLLVGPNRSLQGSLRAGIPHLAPSMDDLATYLGKKSPLLGTSVKGAGHITADISGTLASPAVKGLLQESALDVGSPPRQIAPTTADLVLRDGNLDVTGHIPTYGMAATARLGLRAPYPATLTASLTNTDLGSLPLTLPANLSGMVSLHVDARGSLLTWQSGTAKVRVDQLTADWNHLPIRIQKPAEVDYEADALRVDADLLVKDSPVRVNGDLPLRSGSSGNLHVQTQWNLQTLADLVPRHHILAQGNLDLQATVAGSLRAPRPSLSITINSSRIEDASLRTPITGLVLHAHILGSTIYLDRLSAAWAGGTVRASGQAPYYWLLPNPPKILPSQTGAASATLIVDGVQLQSIHGLPDNLQGKVSLQASASATQPSLDALRSKVTVGELDLRLAGLEFHEPTPGKISVENGTASIADFSLTGPKASIRLQGSATLHSPRSVNLHLDANGDAAILSALTTGLNAQGPVQVSLSATGPLTGPQLSGFIRTRQVRVGILSPPVLADSLDMQVNFQGTRATIDNLKGSLNGGPLTASGGFSFGGGQLRDVDVRVQANDVFFQYPQGLDTLAKLDLKLQTDQQLLRLGGMVTILQGSYQKNLSVEGDLLPYVLHSGGGFTPLEARNGFLNRLRFNLLVQTSSPVVLDNNLGKLGVNANLQVLGDYYNPGLLGRLTVEEGGQLLLNERTYTVDTGTITFTNPQGIEIVPNIVAKTQVSGYDITLQVTKQAGRIQTQLSSSPPLAQPDIVAVLLTGRTLQQAQGQELNLAGQQALSLLAGRLGQTFSSRVQHGLGLTSVRLEPNLISAGSTPGARLTVAQNITSKLNLSYSLNLANSGDQIWEAQYDLTRRFSTQAVKQSDNSYRFEFRHHITFGSISPPSGTRTTNKLFIGNISFSGMPLFPTPKLQNNFGLKTGQHYDFFKVQKGVNRLQKFYFRQDFLSASVRPSRLFQGSKVNLDLHVEAGPKIGFTFEGWNVPGNVRKKVRNEWQQGVFDQQRAANAIGAIQTALVRQGYLQQKVTYRRLQPQGNHQEVVFHIQTGPEYRRVPIVFAGAHQIHPSELKDLLNDQHLMTDVYLNPARVTNLLTAYYRQHGYLAVRLEKPQYRLQPGTGTGSTVIAVHEGSPFRVGKVSFKGNHSYSNAEMRKLVGLPPGGPFLPEQEQTAENKIRQFYLNHGFPDVLVTSSLGEQAAMGIADLQFQISENQQRVIRQIEVTGTHYTTPSLVRKQMLGLQPGDVLNNASLSKAYTTLYTSGAYSQIDVHTQDLPRTGNLKSNQTPVQLRINVREVPPWDLSYGAYYDTDRGPGAIVGLANHNMLGGARTIGLDARYDNLLRTGTIYLTQPALHRYFPKSDLAGYFSRQVYPAFISRKLGFSFLQELPLKSKYVLTYGYRIERDTTIATSPASSVLNSQQRIAPLTLSLTRETRDDLLDPTRGMFLSSTLNVGTRFVGSQSRYASWVGQFFKYVPLSRPVSIPFSGGAHKSRWVWASGVRISLAGGLGGQQLDPSQRFFAGGGTTIRGFGQDEVGPKDANGLPVGGNALLILNQELRFPLFYIFDGAAFVDAGNVYPRIADFNPLHVRSAAGLGLRVHTPYFLLRLDYGIKLDRKPGESFGKLFFSIGQAF